MHIYIYHCILFLFIFCPRPKTFYLTAVCYQDMDVTYYFPNFVFSRYTQTVIKGMGRFFHVFFKITKANLKLLFTCGYPEGLQGSMMKGTPSCSCILAPSWGTCHHPLRSYLLWWHRCVCVCVCVHFLAQDSLRVIAIPLPQLPECWDSMLGPPHLTVSCFQCPEEQVLLSKEHRLNLKHTLSLGGSSSLVSSEFVVIAAVAHWRHLPR